MLLLFPDADATKGLNRPPGGGASLESSDAEE